MGVRKENEQIIESFYEVLHLMLCETITQLLAKNQLFSVLWS